MNWEQARGQWKQLSGEAKRQWGKLTDDDVQTIDGDREKLVGKLQERYGLQKEEAERDANDWITRL
jgi:uncharacterized protein YjbJ (UPF0337 family)